MDALEKAKYEKRAEIDKAKKERLHLYVGEEDVFRYSQDRMRLLEEAEHAGQILVGNVSLSMGLFKVLAGKMSVYERSLMESIVSKYKEIEACENEEEVSEIGVTSGFPDMIHTTNEELQSELEESEHNSAEIQAVSLARSKQEQDASYTLYEVIQDGILQENWIPGTYDTYSIYKVVDIEHEGTQEDPIPYRQGMAFEQGKYYIQYGITYLCILTTVNGYPSDLAELNTIVQPI